MSYLNRFWSLNLLSNTLTSNIKSVPFICCYIICWYRLPYNASLFPAKDKCFSNTNIVSDLIKKYIQRLPKSRQELWLTEIFSILNYIYNCYNINKWYLCLVLEPILCTYKPCYLFKWILPVFRDHVDLSPKYQSVYAWMISK